MKKYTKDQIAILKLLSIESLGHRQRETILALAEHPAELFETPARFAAELSKVGDGVFDKIADVAESFDEERFLRYMEKIGAVALFQGEDAYPEKLLILEDAPIALFCRGDVSLLEGESLAIVGTRAPTRYGRDVTELFAKELAEAGFVVVSGLARGVDAIAHRIALESGAKTVAVLGCGVDKVYPAENKDLYDRIAENGLLVSEFFPGAEPHAFHFPIRNRVISALSQGVLVTEAGEKSGTLITVTDALEQGKDVFIVPGNIFSNASKGANEMLHNPQCMIATDPSDVLSYYGKKTEKAAPDPHQLTTEEVLIYSALQDEDKHFEQLLELTGLSMGDLMATLTKLEVLGVIKKYPGNYYGI
ncbi:MAG: DNA-processing protein DprA [Clostridia bacterium]|nr:DNA-processing protein DprA [Clostridia bacterium]